MESVCTHIDHLEPQTKIIEYNNTLENTFGADVLPLRSVTSLLLVQFSCLRTVLLKQSSMSIAANNPIWEVPSSLTCLYIINDSSCISFKRPPSKYSCTFRKVMLYCSQMVSPEGTTTSGATLHIEQEHFPDSLVQSSSPKTDRSYDWLCILRQENKLSGKWAESILAKMSLKYQQNILTRNRLGAALTREGDDCLFSAVTGVKDLTGNNRTIAQLARQKPE
jgi:hypothetical protein